MITFTITLTDVEEKALLTDMGSIQDWIDNAIHNKARICIDRIVERIDDRQVNKISVREKQDIVRQADIKTAVEENIEFEKKYFESKGIPYPEE